MKRWRQAEKNSVLPYLTSHTKKLLISSPVMPYAVYFGPRLTTLIPLYPWGKSCPTGTHNETVKKLTLFSAFDRSNHVCVYVCACGCIYVSFATIKDIYRVYDLK